MVGMVPLVAAKRRLALVFGAAPFCLAGAGVLSAVYGGWSAMWGGFLLGTFSAMLLGW